VIFLAVPFLLRLGASNNYSFGLLRFIVIYRLDAIAFGIALAFLKRYHAAIWSLLMRSVLNKKAQIYSDESLRSPRPQGRGPGNVLRHAPARRLRRVKGKVKRFLKKRAALQHARPVQENKFQIKAALLQRAALEKDGATPQCRWARPVKTRLDGCHNRCDSLRRMALSLAENMAAA
jgi:hypothetical protein